MVDDKLYCICKTKYDEDRVMIACDRYVIKHRTFSVYLLTESGVIAAMSGTILNA